MKTAKHEKVDEMKGERNNTQPFIGDKSQTKTQLISTSEYNIDDLLEEIYENGKSCVDDLRTLVEMRFPKFDSTDNRKRVRKIIDDVAQEFSTLKSVVA